MLMYSADVFRIPDTPAEPDPEPQPEPTEPKIIPLNGVSYGPKTNSLPQLNTHYFDLNCQKLL